MVYRLLVKEGVVELCLRSLLRQQLERRAVFEDDITPLVLAEAMTTLCKYAYNYVCQVEVFSILIMYM